MPNLPNFTEHEGHTKLESLSNEADLAPPGPFIANWLEEVATKSSRSVNQLRVLDLGCGRGDTVFWLLKHGWDAWGIDTDERYIGVGREFFEKTGLDPDRLRTFDGGRYPFADNMFDVVTSDTVLEHVADLDRLASEVSRVSAPGARGLHSYPSQWRPVETHLRTPLVHWLPKGAPRRALLHILLRTHLSAPYFAGYDINDRVAIFADFSDSETFYRSLGDVRQIFRENNISADDIGPSRRKVSERLPWTPMILRPAVAWLIRATATVAIETTQGA